MKEVNYIVNTHGSWYGNKPVQYETEQDAWDVIDKALFGSGYDVSSPTGKDVSGFIPF